MNKIRNIAVIAHVDHGKTTLVDALLKQTHVFRDNQEEMTQDRILDSNDLERERGITIMAKNCAIEYKGTKINIIDTPGHADFSGEVERTLNMADGTLLIIDAQEGPMPQTRFVLKKALDLGLKIIVVINKIDKPFARINEVISKTESLFLELATTEDQLNFPFLYAVSRTGSVFTDRPTDVNAPGNVIPLLEAIIDYIPAPQNEVNLPFKMLVSSLDHNPHLGRLLVGKIHQGLLNQNQKVVIAKDPSRSYSIEKIMVAEGLGRLEIDQAQAGDIVILSGISEAHIGDTLTDSSDITAIDSQAIGEPTLHLTLGANTAPFSGKEGKYSTSRQLEDRLMRELQTNLSLRVEKLDNGKYKLSGRGELHLAVLLETMRREGFEMEVGKPEVITKTINGVVTEPVEEVSIVVLNEYQGTINQHLLKRLAALIKMEPISDHEVEFIYHMPTRNIIGLRSLLLTATKGTVLFSSQLLGFELQGKPLPKLRSGVLIAGQTGDALAYGLEAAQGRGVTFIGPGTKVYEGMIIGQNSREEDLEINVCKGKKLTNMRSKSSDGIIQLAPPIDLSLEQSLDLLEPDELLEITPISLRLRKKYLSDLERRRHKRNN